MTKTHNDSVLSKTELYFITVALRAALGVLGFNCQIINPCCCLDLGVLKRRNGGRPIIVWKKIDWGSRIIRSDSPILSQGFWAFGEVLEFCGAFGDAHSGDNAFLNVPWGSCHLVRGA